jgi:superfamily I DNA/RNA helicase
MPSVDHRSERSKDLGRIKDSARPRKVVVAGPGTGKSFLFSELIKKKRAEGKTKFLAITFIGKLGDSLADDLCGLAKTTTMHSYAREFVLQYAKNWDYYPRMSELIAEDLKGEGIDKFEIGDENYLAKTKHYRAVGDGDVVHYAIRICRKDGTKIPEFDLVLVDEYQDFNKTEAEFVDLLAEKNEVLIVGDDDQALYEFKGSSPSFIRAKYSPDNTDWESFTLRFCSRCTEVMIKYFHSLLAQFDPGNLPDIDTVKKRIEKEFICYAPEGEADSKGHDSKNNPKICLIKGCPVGMIAYKIKAELEKLVQSQKIKEVLVIGEARSCRPLLSTAAEQLKDYGFRNVDRRGEGEVIPIRQNTVDAYRFLAKNESSLLGWGILGNPADAKMRTKHLKNAETLNKLINGTHSKIKKIKHADILLLEDAIEDWDLPGQGQNEDRSDNAEVEASRHQEQGVLIRRRVLVEELKRSNLYLPRPLCNLDITVCNTLNSKGLGADVVFLIGFDQGKFPAQNSPTESEVYQMLVASTRAKKRMYLINTIGSAVSGFAGCLDASDLDVEEVKPKTSGSSKKIV